MSKQAAMRAAEIIRDAGGRIVGRTKLQKIAFFLEEAGLGNEFPFSYKLYGPYSEELSSAIRMATLMNIVSEQVLNTNWGGSYSIYSSNQVAEVDSTNPRLILAKIASQADAVELELAATALLLNKEGYSDPWSETAKRKPEKAIDNRLESSKLLYKKLSAINTPRRLPSIA